MRSISTFFVVLLFSLLSPAQILSQSMPGIDLMSSVTTETAIRQKFGQRITSQLNAPAAADVRPAEPYFVYRYDSVRTQQNLQAFVEKTPENAGRADLEQMIAQQPYIMSDIRNAVRQFGLDTHNVADAYVLWWVNVWSAWQKTDRQPTSSMIDSVKRQARDALIATPDFANMSDAERQEYAEALILQAILLSAAFDQSKGNPALLDQLSNAAFQGAMANGLDLSLMILTDDGFVPSR